MNPFDLAGPTFLLLYGVLSLFVLLGAWLHRKRSESGSISRLDLSNPYLIAYLRGGENETVEQGGGPSGWTPMQSGCGFNVPQATFRHRCSHRGTACETGATALYRPCFLLHRQMQGAAGLAPQIGRAHV